MHQLSQSKTIAQLPDYLENYYGKKLGSYHLILSPLMHSGGFNSEIINSKGEREVYAAVGPNGEIDFVPYFDKDYLEMDLILHEFGHSFVNPLMEKYAKEIESLKSKYDTEHFANIAKEQGYGEWKYAFNELVVRAATIKITAKHFGKVKANELLDYEKSIGFTLVETIVNLLDEYSNQHDTKFDDFYPVMLKRLSVLKKLD
jgi:hypothetical protein